MKKLLTIAIIIFLLLVFYPHQNMKATGLSVQYNLVGEFDGDVYGYPVAFFGDVNNDTYEDFAVGATGFDNGSIEDAGKVYVYSGQDGSLIRSHIGTATSGYYGSAILGIGDVNDDNYDDYAILDPRYGGTNIEYGRLLAYSGIDGSALWTYTGNTIYQFQFGGAQMSMTSDFNSDGKPDLAVGAPGMGVLAIQGGAILIISAVDGTVINQYNGDSQLYRDGAIMDSGYDINGDGKQDFIIGQPRAMVSGNWGAGRVKIISGADFSTVLVTKDGPAQRFAGFGASVALVGDNNKDGTPDFSVGSYEEVGGVWFAGALYLFSGTTTQPQLAKYNGSESNELFGQVVADVGDPNNDGYADIGITALQGTNGGNAAAGRVEVYSGKINSRWAKAGGGAVGELFGSDIKGGVDVNKDGSPDVLIGSTGGKFGLDTTGRARFYLSNPGHTPTGTNIEVHPISGRINDILTFASVTTDGDTSAAYNPASGENFYTKQGSNQENWSITTNAVFSGNITVCLNYNDALYANESQIGISHLEGNWTKKTTTLDTVNNIACATVTSL